MARQQHIVTETSDYSIRWVFQPGSKFEVMLFKNLQYVMGHSDVGVTLNVYAHASYDRAAEQMAKIVDFKETDMQEKKRKSS